MQLQLPIIELSPKQITTLEVIDGGNESIITKSGRSGTLYKIFSYDIENDNYDTNDDEYDDEQKEDSDRDLEELYCNKANKLNAIYNMPALQYSVLPLSIINSDGKFIGYEMTYDRKDIPLSSAVLSIADRINTLRRVKLILEYYSSRGIIYGDVRSSNILINRLTRALKFCDIDNIGLGSLEIDVLPTIADKFINERGRVDQTLSMYMYNLLALEQIAYPGKKYNTILNRLKNGEMPPNFKSDAERVIDGMLQPKSFQGESILQYVKKVDDDYAKNA